MCYSRPQQHVFVIFQFHPFTFSCDSHLMVLKQNKFIPQDSCFQGTTKVRIGRNDWWCSGVCYSYAIFSDTIGPDRELNFDKFLCSKCCKSLSFNLVQRTRRTLHLLVSFNDLGAKLFWDIPSIPPIKRFCLSISSWGGVIRNWSSRIYIYWGNSLRSIPSSILGWQFLIFIFCCCFLQI